jgi:hypothetical protein
MQLWQWRLSLLSGLFCAAVLFAVPSLAHHSYGAYDLNQTRTLKGTVETFHWSNPHSTFTLVLEPEASGEPIKWNVITSGPAVLKRFGWTQHSLKPGDRVSVICNPMSDGSHGGRLHTVVLLDTGQVLRTKFSADVSFVWPGALRLVENSEAMGVTFRPRVGTHRRC